MGAWYSTKILILKTIILQLVTIKLLVTNKCSKIYVNVAEFTEEISCK